MTEPTEVPDELTEVPDELTDWVLVPLCGLEIVHVLADIRDVTHVSNPSVMVKFYPCSTHPDSVYGNTTHYIATFLVAEWDAVMMETDGKLETVYQHMNKGEFKTKARGKTPHYVFKTMKEQNFAFTKRLQDMKEEHPDLTKETSDWEAIEKITGFDLEKSAKLTWTENKTPRGGIEYIVQFRTQTLRVLVKVAPDNFVSFFVKTLFPPTDEAALKAFKQRCHDLKFALIGSLIRRQEDGLLHFYESIRVFDDWCL
jgi:hypothetical protein